MKPPGAQGSQSTYTDLLSVIEEMGKEIRPTYAGSKSAMERLKRGRGGGGTGRPRGCTSEAPQRRGEQPEGDSWCPCAFPRRDYPRPGAGQGVPGRDRAKRPHVTAAATRDPLGPPGGGGGGGGAAVLPEPPLPALSALYKCVFL